jgi:hypothetical protein
LENRAHETTNEVSHAYAQEQSGYDRAKQNRAPSRERLLGIVGRLVENDKLDH